MENDIKYRITIEDIVFWLIILGIIAIVLWMLHGSPTEMGAIMGIGTFFGASELLIWRKLFHIENKFNLKISKLDKSTTVGFVKVKHDIDRNHIELMNELKHIRERL